MVALLRTRPSDVLTDPTLNQEDPSVEYCQEPSVAASDRFPTITTPANSSLSGSLNLLENSASTVCPLFPVGSSRIVVAATFAVNDGSSFNAETLKVIV